MKQQHSHCEERRKQMLNEELEAAFERLGPHLNEIEKILSGQMSDEEMAVALKRVVEQIPEENIGLCYKLFFKLIFEEKSNECESAQLSEEQFGKCVKNYFECISKENLAVLIKFINN